MIYDVVTFLICLLTLVVEEEEEEEEEEESSEDESWTAKEASVDDETAMRGFETIDPDERYAEVSYLSDNLGLMSLGNPKRYNITKDQTFMVYDFIHNTKKYCQVDMLVPSMGRDKFGPKVIPGGRKLAISMVCPSFFFGYDRLEMANQQSKSFNQNTHKATALEEALRKMRKELNVRKGGDISGPDLVISLPFSCEETIVKWGLLSFENLDSEVVIKNRPDVQMFDVLSLTLVSDEKLESEEEEENEGELSMFKTPRRSKKDNTSSTPASASNPVPDPTNKESEPAKKVRRSSRAKKRTISFVNHPINESFESSFETAAEQSKTDSKTSIDSNELLSLDDDNNENLFSL